jgi:aryl-alcohol dehydrogenase-like predicted oxidoreductase
VYGEIDKDTPIETTLRALDNAVRRGKTRYVGASSTWAYQFADALHTSERIGLKRFATV